MLFKIVHETRLAYTDLIAETVMELHMAPRQEQTQHRLAFELAIGPATRVQSYFDFLGNLVHAFSVNAPHRALHITASSVVQTNTAVDPAELSDAYQPDVADDYTLFDYLHFGRIVSDCPQLRALVRQLDVRPGQRVAEVLRRLMVHIHDSFTYERGATTAASPISDILHHGRGVCQDFTHLMIGACRALKIPARYVSGFIYSGQQGYRGAAQTHAWCEAWFRDAGVWVGFDPTNNCAVGQQFVKVAVGRDYHDVPPNRGVYRGQAEETMEVAVQMQQLPQLPSKLRAEFIHGLNVPVYTGGNGYHVSADGSLHDQQQQQQQVEQQQQ